MSEKPAVEGKEPEQLDVDLKEDRSLREELEAAMEAGDDSNDAGDGEGASGDAPAKEADGDEKTASEAGEGDSGEAEAPAKSEDSEGDPEPLEPPAHWAAEDQKLFLAQPREAQEFLLKRHKSMEADYTTKTQELAPLRKSLEHWQPYINQIGTTADQILDKLLGAEHILRTGTAQQKQAAIQHLIRDYGVQFGEQQQQDEFSDPEIQSAIKPLQDQIQALTQQTQRQQSQDESSRVAAMEQQITAFVEEKDDKGNLAHPYFQEVLPQVYSLAQAEKLAGNAPDLAELYERAVWAVPETREKLLLAQQRAAQKAENEKKQERVKKAKDASASVSGGGGGVTEQPKTLREELEAQFAAA